MEQILGIVSAAIIKAVAPANTTVLWGKIIGPGVVEFHRWNGTEWVKISDDILAELGDLALQSKNAVELTGGLISNVGVEKLKYLSLVINANHSMQPEETVLLVDTAAGAIAIELPPAAGAWLMGKGMRYTVIKTDASANAVTISAPGGNIGYPLVASIQIIAQGNSLTFQAISGANYVVFK